MFVTFSSFIHGRVDGKRIVDYISQVGRGLEGTKKVTTYPNNRVYSHTNN